MRIFNFKNQAEAKKVMRVIGVDPCGVEIMAQKALNLAVLLKNLSNISANILKQEMLSLGADAAVARGALTGKVKQTDVLIIGTLAQFNGLVLKLKRQPFGLARTGFELEREIKNYCRDNLVLSLRKCSFDLGKRTHIMGIINLTPDSFSHDGLYRPGSDRHIRLALEKAQCMQKEGADMIDVGGQSSRPGAKSVSTKEELRRVIPALKFLSKKIKLPISIDTAKPEVAKAALDCGAQIINDISGLRDKKMLKVASRYRAAIIIMHMLGTPRSMQKMISYHSLIEEIALYLKDAVSRAEAGGIKSNKIVIDPGIGFGKTAYHNLQIIRNLAEFKAIGKPILLGPSRKSFIASVLGNPSANRLNANLAACVMSALAGANILRVHGVKEINECLKMVNAVKNADK